MPTINDLTEDQRERFGDALEEAKDVFDDRAEWQVNLDDLTHEQLDRINKALDEAISLLNEAESEDDSDG